VNKIQLSLLSVLVLLLINVAYYGVVVEAGTAGKTNGFAYIFYVLPSLTIAIGLLSGFILSRRQNFKSAFKKSCLISFIPFLLLGLLGQIYYRGAFKALEWFKIFYYNPFEVILPLGIICLVLFILEGLVYIVGKVGMKKL
jgi:hypothetical protein